MECRYLFICRGLKMSKKNREMMYKKLVAAGRFADIDEGLIKEFGKPAPVQSFDGVKKKVK